MKNDKLRTLGLKATGPRLKILQLLGEPDAGHMGVEEIHRRLQERKENVSLATVYRVLMQFEEAGLVKRHSFDGEAAIYELDEGEHHDHMVCSSCGAVLEFVDEVIEQRQIAIAESRNFVISDHSLIIYGVCEPCQST